MRYIRFSPNTVTIYFKEKNRFDYKNNYRRGKLDNFWLDNISKINYITLVILSYTLLGSKSRKI